MKKYISILVLGLCVLFFAGMNFLNSAQTKEVSNETSKKVTEQIKKVVDPENKKSETDMNDMMRKVAHVVEFFALGISLSLFVKQLSKLTKKDYCCLSVFVGLLVAVADEYIQVYSKRGSMVQDVLIDFSGVLAGVLLVNLIVFTIKKRSRM